MSARQRLSEDDFQAWRAHPVTEIVDQYRRDLVTYIRGCWAEGNSWNDEALAEVRLLEGELVLDLDTINEFYEAEENEQNRDRPGNLDADQTAE